MPKSSFTSSYLLSHDYRACGKHALCLLQGCNAVEHVQGSGSHKRKTSAAIRQHAAERRTLVVHARKTAKLSFGLPAEVWHHIYIFEMDVLNAKEAAAFHALGQCRTRE